MYEFLYYSQAWPYIVTGKFAEFLVWDLFSDGSWREQQRRYNPTVYWQGYAIGAERQLREHKYKSRREFEETERKFREERKRKEREISYLRS